MKFFLKCRIFSLNRVFRLFKLIALTDDCLEIPKTPQFPDTRQTTHTEPRSRILKKFLQPHTTHFLHLPKQTS